MQPRLRTPARSQFIALWSSLFSVCFILQKSIPRLPCLSSHNNLNRKKILNNKVLSPSIHIAMNLSCLGLLILFIPITVAKGWGTNPPLWSGILIDNLPETLGLETEQVPQRSKRTEQEKSVHIIWLNKTSYTSSFFFFFSWCNLLSAWFASAIFS